MELRHFRYFVALAEELHFGRAAARLCISQPPLSQQIRALEDELNCRLLDRDSRSVVLTDAGKLFLEEARKVLKQAERAQQIAGRAQQGMVGEISLAMFPSGPLVSEVVAFLKYIRAEMPDVHLAMQEQSSNDVIMDMVEGAVDVAFLRYPNRPPIPGGFEAKKMAVENYVAIMSEDHPLGSDASPIGLEALGDQEFIHFPVHKRYALSTHFHEMCGVAGFRPNVVHEANDNSMIVALVGAGFGISVVPESISYLCPRRIRARKIINPQASSSIWFVHASNPSQPLLRALVAHYIAYAGGDSFVKHIAVN